MNKLWRTHNVHHIGHSREGLLGWEVEKICSKMQEGSFEVTEDLPSESYENELSQSK